MRPYSYYEVTLSYPLAAESAQTRVTDFFTAHKFRWEDIVFCESSKGAAASVYTRSLKDANLLRKKSAEVLGRGFRLKVKLLVKEDWFDKWQLDYQIMPIGKKFTLVPFWHLKKYRPSGSRIPIYLDPKGASGSGQHPTTQIMAEFLESIAGNFETCLDLGAGTGILGILAAKLGAQEVTAIDNDAVAVKAARFNLSYNRVPSFEVRSSDLTGNDKKSRRRYDLVCANLISPVLDAIRKALFNSVKPGGYLLVSGIHIQNFDWFRKRFRDKRFRCLKITKKRGWSGFVFKRT